jgi:hypothetical protein
MDSAGRPQLDLASQLKWEKLEINRIGPGRPEPKPNQEPLLRADKKAQRPKNNEFGSR